MSKQMIGSLKSKKVKKNKGKKVTKNALTLKHDTFWPLVSDDDANNIRNIFEKHLSVVNSCKPKVPWYILMKMTREQRKARIEEEKESLPPEEKQKILESNRARKHLTIGLNMTVRQMEQGKLLFLLVDSINPPDILLSKLLILAKEKQIPIGLLPNLNELLKSILNFPTIVLGFKKSLLEDTCPIKGCLEVKTVLDKLNAKPPMKSLLLDNRENSPDEELKQLRLPDILLFRSSVDERVFKPNIISTSTKAANYIEVDTRSHSSSLTRQTFKRYTDQNASDVTQKSFESPLVVTVQSNSNKNRKR